MPARPRSIFVLCLCLLAPLAVSAPLAAQAPAPAADHLEPGPDTGGLTLEVIMADPDWLGRAPRERLLGRRRRVRLLRAKREGEPLFDLYRSTSRGTAPGRGRRAGEISPPVGDWSRDRSRKVYTREGDVYLRDVRTGEVRQLTRTAANESQAMFLDDEDRIAFRRGDAFYVRDLDSGLEWQPAEVLAEKDPAEVEADEERIEGYLARQQEDLFEIVRQREERARERRERSEEERRATPPARRCPSTWATT